MSPLPPVFHCSAVLPPPPHYCEMPAALLPTEALLLVPKLLLTQKSPAARHSVFSNASRRHCSYVPLSIEITLRSIIMTSDCGVALDLT